MEQDVFVIAEAGVNHNGDIDLAKKLVYAAKQAGADAIKFQTFKAENLVLKSAKKAEYQKERTASEESQFDMLKKLELSQEEFQELKEYCDSLGILFLSTPFDSDSITFLNEIMDIPVFKIPSGEITNVPYLEQVAKCDKPIILSTGMSTMDEVENAIQIISKHNKKKLTLLHCTTDYPANPEKANLKAMLAMKEKFNLPIGYSDHTLGDFVPLLAVAMGATVIEKHFTLDKTMEGPDHAASMEKDELEEMIKKIRRIGKIHGDGVKKPSEEEEKNILVARKSIVAKQKIMQGEAFTEENLTTKRPGDGISAIHWYELLGKVASRDYEEDEKIEESLK